MRRPLRWLSLIIAFNLVSPTVVAQPKKPAKTVGEELPADARREWNAGLQLLGDNNFPAAVVQFQRVYDMTKNPRTLPNLALAHKGNKSYLRAIRAYERALAEGASSIPANDQKDIKDSIAALKPFVTTLEITTSVPGAAVNVEGEDVGTTPLPKPIEVSTGDIPVRVTKEGFREQSRVVKVGVGQPATAKFELVPERLMAVVTVTAEGAPRANIRIDGIEMGASPYKGQVEVGKRHTFEAYANRFTPARQSLEVSKPEPFDVVLTLSESRNEGRVAVVARPAGATIEIDNRIVGVDKWEGALAASGGHRVRIFKDGYIDEVQEISVAPDQTRRIETTLRQDQSRGALYWAIGTVLVVGGGVAAGILIASQGRDAQPVSGTIAPPVTGIVPTWRH